MGSVSVLNIEIPNFSPVVHYYPFAETYAAADLNAGWAPWFSESGYQTDPGLRGKGEPYHLTALDGAQFGIEFQGSRITLYGNATSGTYDVKLDDKDVSTTYQDGVLAVISDVPPGKHRVLLTAHSSSSAPLFFRKAVIDVDTGLKEAHISNEGSGINALATTGLNTGEWRITTDDDVKKQYLMAARVGASISMHLTGGSAVRVMGLRDMDHGLYNVTLDDVTTQYDAKSGFKTDTLLYYATGLDPGIPHSLTISNAVDGATLAVADVQITYVSGGYTDSAPVASGISGTTVALIIGGVIAALALIGLGIWRWNVRARRRAWDRRRFLKRLSVDEALGTNAKEQLLPSPNFAYRKSGASRKSEESDIQPLSGRRSEYWRDAVIKAGRHTRQSSSVGSSTSFVHVIRPSSDDSHHTDVPHLPPTPPSLAVPSSTPFFIDITRLFRSNTRSSARRGGSSSGHGHQDGSSGAESNFLSLTDTKAETTPSASRRESGQQVQPQEILLPALPDSPAILPPSEKPSLAVHPPSIWASRLSIGVPMGTPSNFPQSPMTPYTAMTTSPTSMDFGAYPASQHSDHPPSSFLHARGDGSDSSNQPSSAGHSITSSDIYAAFSNAELEAVGSGHPVHSPTATELTHHVDVSPIPLVASGSGPRRSSHIRESAEQEVRPYPPPQHPPRLMQSIQIIEPPLPYRNPSSRRNSKPLGTRLNTRRISLDNEPPQSPTESIPFSTTPIQFRVPSGDDDDDEHDRRFAGRSTYSITSEEILNGLSNSPPFVGPSPPPIAQHPNFAPLPEHLLARFRTPPPNSRIIQLLKPQSSPGGRPPPPLPPAPPSS